MVRQYVPGLDSAHRRGSLRRRMAIRNGTEMDERYSPQALKVLAKATRFALREIEGVRRRPIAAHVTAYVISVGEFVSPTMADRMMHLIRSKGYIVDVATSIISYDTLYNLHCTFVPTESEARAPLGS